MLVHDASPEDACEVRARLAETGNTLADADSVPLSLAVRDDCGRLIAGLLGSTFERWLYVSHLWVDDKVRRCGLGSRLLDHAMGMARARGCRRVHLETRSPEGLAFYRRHGFYVAGQIPGFLNGKPLWFLYRSLAGDKNGAPFN